MNTEKWYRAYEPLDKKYVGPERATEGEAREDASRYNDSSSDYMACACVVSDGWEIRAAERAKANLEEDLAECRRNAKYGRK